MVSENDTRYGTVGTASNLDLTLSSGHVILGRFMTILQHDHSCSSGQSYLNLYNLINRTFSDRGKRQSFTGARSDVGKLEKEKPYAAQTVVLSASDRGPRYTVPVQVQVQVRRNLRMYI